jgi:hypothetical protein
VTDTPATEADYLARLDAMTREEEVAYRLEEAGGDENLAELMVRVRRGEATGHLEETDADA